VLQASQVEVGITRKKLRVTLAQWEHSRVSETGVEYGVRSDRKETRTVEKTYKLNTIRYRNMI
jgi:hypothetical protein